MALFPVNTLVFTGNGGGQGMRFVSPAGVDLGQPTPAPATNKYWEEIATRSDGYIVTHEDGVGTYIFAPDFSTYTLVPGPSYSGSAFYTGACDGLGNFYFVVKNVGATAAQVVKVPSSGSPSIIATVSGNLEFIAVNQSGTTIYLSTNLQSPMVVKKLDVASLTVTTFLSRTPPINKYSAPMLVLPDDSLIVGWGTFSALNSWWPIRYDTSGGIIAQYSALPSYYYASENGIQFAYNNDGTIDTTSIFMSYWRYEPSVPAGLYGNAIARINVSTGAVISVVDLPSTVDGFNYEGYFTTLRTVSGPTPPTLPSSPVESTVQGCCGTPSTSSSPGIVLPQITLTWQQSLTGGGAVDTAPDPSDSENWAL